MNKEIWKIAFACTGVIVGAGFSIGQEILQFFSYLAILLSALIVLFIGREATKFGYKIQIRSPKDFSRKFPIFLLTYKMLFECLGISNALVRHLIYIRIATQ